MQESKAISHKALFDKAKIIVSDCHLSAGRFFANRLNPHEDFYFDEELTDLLKYFSSGVYASQEDQVREVELILGGDFLDFLNVPVNGEFEDAIDEEVAVYKAKAIIEGHPAVTEAFRRFVSQPGKKLPI